MMKLGETLFKVSNQSETREELLMDRELNSFMIFALFIVSIERYF